MSSGKVRWHRVRVFRFCPPSAESGHADTVGYALAFNFAHISTSASNPLALAAIASAAKVSPPPVYALPVAQLQWQTGGDQGDGGLGVGNRK